MIKRGTTRITVLLGDFAIKIPILNRSLKHFVKGWLGNVDERDAWKRFAKEHNYKSFQERTVMTGATTIEKLCPIYFSLFGLLNIMPRAKPVKDKEFKKQWALEHFKDCGVHIDVCSGWKNFGYISGYPNPVLLDYATCRESNEYCSDCDNDCILKSEAK